MSLEDITLDLATADRVVAVADPNLGATEVQRLTAGMNAVFRVRTIDGGAVVVKLYPDEWRWKLEKEAFVLDILRRHELGVPIPTVLAVDESKTLLPDSFLVMTALEGRHLRSVVDSLPGRELVDVNRQVGAVLRSLHDVEFEAFGYVGPNGIAEPHATNADYMRSQFAKKLRGFQEFGGDAALRRRIELHVREREGLLAECARPSYCHNDCHDGNLLVVPADRRWRVSGLVDFENVVAGDPILDLAKTHYYAQHYGHRRSHAALEALADGHGALRDGWRDALPVYVLYHALELWDWLAFVGQTEPLDEIAADIRRLVDGHGASATSAVPL